MQVDREVNTVAVSLVAMTALSPTQGLWLCVCVCAWGGRVVYMYLCSCVDKLKFNTIVVRTFWLVFTTAKGCLRVETWF